MGKPETDRFALSGPFVHTHEEEHLRVTCPYCPGGVGYVVVKVTRKGGEAQVQGLQEPRKCNTCRRYFRVAPHVRLEGVPLTDMEQLSMAQIRKGLTDGC